MYVCISAYVENGFYIFIYRCFSMLLYTRTSVYKYAGGQ